MDCFRSVYRLGFGEELILKNEMLRDGMVQLCFTLPKNTTNVSIWKNKNKIPLEKFMFRKEGIVLNGERLVQQGARRYKFVFEVNISSNVVVRTYAYLVYYGTTKIMQVFFV